jgi:hypothetical protein
MKSIILFLFWGLALTGCGDSEFESRSTTKRASFDAAAKEVSEDDNNAQGTDLNGQDNNADNADGTSNGDGGDNAEGNSDNIDDDEELSLAEIEEIEDDDIRNCLFNFDHTFKKGVLKNVVVHEVTTDVPVAALSQLASVNGPKKEHIVILNVRTIADAIADLKITNEKAFVCINRSPGKLPVLGIPAPISASVLFHVKTKCVEQVSINWQGVVHVGAGVIQEGSSKKCLVK